MLIPSTGCSCIWKDAQYNNAYVVVSISETVGVFRYSYMWAFSCFDCFGTHTPVPSVYMIIHSCTCFNVCVYMLMNLNVQLCIDIHMWVI